MIVVGMYAKCNNCGKLSAPVPSRGTKDQKSRVHLAKLVRAHGWHVSELQLHEKDGSVSITEAFVCPACIKIEASFGHNELALFSSPATVEDE